MNIQNFLYVRSLRLGDYIGNEKKTFSFSRFILFYFIFIFISFWSLAVFGPNLLLVPEVAELLSSAVVIDAWHRFRRLRVRRIYFYEIKYISSHHFTNDIRSSFEDIYVKMEHTLLTVAGKTQSITYQKVTKFNVFNTQPSCFLLSLFLLFLFIVTLKRVFEKGRQATKEFDSALWCHISQSNTHQKCHFTWTWNLLHASTANHKMEVRQWANGAL